MGGRDVRRAGVVFLTGWLTFASGLGHIQAADGSSGRVVVLRTPGAGIQPQAVIDPAGTIHLVYYVGDPVAGDLEYTQLEPGRADFSRPVRVNSEPGCAVAKGTIRGAQVALGRNGRIHVAWNGSMGARPVNPNGGAPMLYTRSDESRTRFEPQRNLMLRTTELDGGGTVAADRKGRVIVAWHGRTPNVSDAARTNGEASRRLFIAESSDDGARFQTERPAVDRLTGACPCCGTRALATQDGGVYVLFRAAARGVDRDMVLLSSRDQGLHFEDVRADVWQTTVCPMSSASLAEGKNGVIAAWETKGQVYFSRIDPKTGRLSPPVHPRGNTDNRKHPAVAVNARGEIALAWTEGTTFQRGGSLCWRVFDATGRQTDEAGRVEGGILVSSLPTVVARPDGGFAVIH